MRRGKVDHDAHRLQIGWRAEYGLRATTGMEQRETREGHTGMKAPDGKRITIVYCADCGYTRRAIKLADNILEEFFEFLPGGVQIVPGSNEIFDVYLDDDRIFSKYALQRHYIDREIEDRLIELLES
ncbi:MAG: SelT/SelW/SelH family protein [Thermomicrobiales bacterium]